MIGFLLFLCSIDLLPHFSFVLLTLLVLFLNRKNIIINRLDAKLVVNLIIISIITVLSFLNSFIHINKLNSYFNLFPYVSLMFCSLIIGKYLTLKDIKIFVSLVVFEALICVLEFWLKVNTLFFWKDYYEYYPTSMPNLLYFRATNGLSNNSSVVAEKILGSILLLLYFKPVNKKYNIIYLVSLFIGLVLSFQRTSLLVLVIFVGFQLAISFWNFIIKQKLTFRFTLKVLAMLIVFIGIVSVAVIKYNSIYNQFSRNTETIGLSGREDIWPKYIDFIQDNLYFGYYSQKYKVDYGGEKDSAHAHNSYLQVLANHGIFIFLLFMILVVVNINKYNWAYISSFLIVSLTQYSLFWGVSLIDIFFFIFALHLPNNEVNLQYKHKLIS